MDKLKHKRGELVSRVAVFIPGIKGGGAERFSCLLAGGLAEAGHQVMLITGPRETEEYGISERVRREILADESLRMDLGGLRRWSNALRNCCRQNELEVCIAVGIAPSLISCVVAGTVPTKFVVCERNAPKQDSISTKSRVARFLLYRRADAYVFQTPGAQSFYSSRIQARSVVIPNPVLPGLPKWSPKGRHEIAAVGRLMPQKNYPLMLESFARVHAVHPDWKLRIFGEGHYLDDYMQIAERLGISGAVKFEGFRSDVHDCIAECDLYLMTSDFEGMPNSLLEAMAMGMPCISTDCPAGGPASLIEDGVNGLLCRVGDERGIAHAVSRLIDVEDLRKSLAAGALRLREHYSVENVVMLWDEFLTDLARGGSFGEQRCC